MIQFQLSFHDCISPIPFPPPHFTFVMVILESLSAHYNLLSGLASTIYKKTLLTWVTFFKHTFKLYAREFV